MTDKGKLKWRLWFDRMISDESLKVMMEAHNLVTDAAFYLIRTHGNDASTSTMNHDGNLLLQMTALKGMSIKSMALPKNLKIQADGTTVGGVNDPFGMICLVRSQMEAFCTFNNMFINSNSDEELQVKYDLWVMSGLKYRQRFGVELEEHVAKKEKEAKQIDEIMQSIESSDLHKGLSEQGLKNFKQMVKGKDWKFRVDGNSIKTLHWHEALTDSGANDMLEQKYNFLSLGSHPSNVSVFQFGQMYVKGEHEFTARMALMFSNVFLSFFIRDYIKYHGLIEKCFDTLPLENQMMVNWYNRAFRSKEYQVNDALSLLD